jgi:hypothetical protein
MDQRTAETSHPCLLCRDQECLSKEALLGSALPARSDYRRHSNGTALPCRSSFKIYQGVTSREQCIHSTAMCIKHHPQPVDTSEVNG